ncbi:WAT1-related protein At1g25270 [Linum grandiflorum]
MQNLLTISQTSSSSSAASMEILRGFLHGLGPLIIMLVIQAAYTVMIILYKLALNDGMNLRILIAYRLIFGTAFITPLAVFLERASLQQLLYAESLALTSPTFATAMTNLSPAITLSLAVICRSERLRLKTRVGKAKAAGTLIGVAGATVMTFYKGVEFKGMSTNFKLMRSSHQHHMDHPQTAIGNVLGLLTGLGSCISYAIWLIMQSRVGEKYPSTCHYSTTALMTFMASIQTVAYCLWVERDWSQWRLGWNVRLLGSAFSGIVASGLAMIAIVQIVEIRGPVFTSAFNPLSLVFVAIISCLMLGEVLHLGSLIGGILIVCGLYLVLWGKVKEFEPKPDGLEKETIIITVDAKSTSPDAGSISLPVLNSTPLGYGRPN